MNLAGALAGAIDPAVLAARQGFDLEPWQLQLLRSTSPRLLVNAARQVGKTSMTATLGLHRATYHAGSLVLILSPSQRQSDEVLLKVKAAYRLLGRPVDAAGESAAELRLVNGSRILSLPGTPQTTRGFSAADLLICDESAWLEDEVFEAVLPTLSPTGRLIALSTPHGMRGWWANAWRDGGEAWERIRITAPESAQYTPARMAAIKAAVGSWAWRGDYLCEFTSTDESFFSLEAIQVALTPSYTPMFGGS